jgi:hypothetical protein
MSPLLQSLEGFSQSQAEDCAAVNRRADELGIATRVEPSGAGGGYPTGGGESGIVVKRKGVGTLPLDDLPVDQREGYHPLVSQERQ